MKDRSSSVIGLTTENARKLALCSIKLAALYDQPLHAAKLFTKLESKELPNVLTIVELGFYYRLY